MTRLTINNKKLATKWRRPQDAPRIGNSPLIYSSPELQNLGVRALWHFSTAAMWSLVAYMLIPLSTLSVWIISAILGYTQLVANDVYLETISQLKLYLLIISIIGTAVILKLIFNIFTQNINFRNKSQDSKTEHLNIINSAHASTKVDVTSKFLTESNYKRMVAHHDEHGHLVGVDMLPSYLTELKKQPFLSQPTNSNNRPAPSPQYQTPSHDQGWYEPVASRA